MVKTIESKKRIIWIDIIRIICTWGVICIHTRADDFNELPRFTYKWNMSAFWGIPWVCCVPIFLMLSGMLILRAEHAPSFANIFGKKIPRLVGAKVFQVMIWIIMSLALFFYAHESDMSEMLKRALTYDGALYFLMILIGCYLITPLIWDFCHNKKLEEYFIILGVVCSIGIPLCQNVPVLSGIVGYFDNSSQLYFPLGIMIYYVLGHYWASYYNDLNKRNCGIVLVGSTILLYVISFYCLKNEGGWMDIIFNSSKYGYMSILVLGWSCTAFVCLMNLLKDFSMSEKLEKMVRHMGRNSIAIYVLHMPLVTFIEEVLNVNPSDFKIYSVGVILEVTIIFMLGYGLSLIWERIPIIKKIIV